MKKKKRNKYVITSAVAFCAAVCCIAALSIKDHSPNSTENKVSDIEASNSTNDTTEQSTSSSEVTSREENKSSEVETSNSINNTTEQSTSNKKVASKENNTEAGTDAVYNSAGNSDKNEFTTQIPEQYNSSNETVQYTDNPSEIYSPAGCYNSRGMLENAKKIQYNRLDKI